MSDISESVFNGVDISAFTADDFDTVAPYELVESIEDPFQRQRAENHLDAHAKTVGYGGFKKMLTVYRKSLKNVGGGGAYRYDNVTMFDGQSLELNSGEWTADEGGITRRTANGEEVACVHPIMPTERLVNIDTGIEKVRISYRTLRQWRDTVTDRRAVSVANSITALADNGISVTSESSKALVRYIQDMLNLNEKIIPVSQGVSRLGWINEEQFSPYCGDIKFDGDVNLRNMYGAVSERGDPQYWLDMCRHIRTGTVESRILLAASFASALVAPLGALPFIVHVWGGAGTGKTVALMLAASVWANPEVGKYIQTFNSTAVGKELAAAFVNSMPLILDELQVARNRYGHDEDIYRLAEGAGKTRGNKSLGVNKTPQWRNCIMTSGEMPLTGVSSGGGAMNRVLDIECGENLFHDARMIARSVRESYGHGGKMFVDMLLGGGLEKAKSLNDEYYAELVKTDTTEKQAGSAAIIMTADRLTQEHIFKDGRVITTAELGEFLRSKTAVDPNVRGYEYMRQWVAQNSNRFGGHSKEGDVWGKLLDNGRWVYVVSSIFRRVAEDAGYNAAALLSYLKKNRHIQTRGKNMTLGKRINGILTECVVMELLQGYEESPDEVPSAF